MNPQATKQLDKGGDAFVPVKNRYRSKHNQNKENKQPNTKPAKFPGLNKDELEGIVISESSNIPTAQQYDALLDATIVYAGSRNPRVKASLRSWTYLTLDDLKPKPPDPTLAFIRSEKSSA